ncbi:MAG: hypothetical protein HC800_24800 [Phormidesmis sp. RL_2_1]|nr:hypothetical protein [Phormidesmis sp. RL_2_1]
MFDQWLAPQRRTARLAEAMRSLFVEEGDPATERSETLFDIDEFAVNSPSKRQVRRAADIVLDKQLDLFGA